MANQDREPLWLPVARELQAVAQAGLTYATDAFDRERYEAVREAAAKLLAQGFAIDPLATRDALANLKGYPTPQVDVRGAIFRGDRILLVQERSDGRWSLPGGWADVNLTPAENVAKEVEEEAGLLVRAHRLAAVYDRSRHGYAPPQPRYVYKLYFLCEEQGGALAAGTETADAAFFDLEALPELSTGRVIETHIHEVHAHHRDPARPTTFD